MGVINVQGSPSFSIHRSEAANQRKSRLLKKPFCSFGKSTARVYCVQASSPAVDESNSTTIMGDSFLRPHLRQLSAYQPILPFEVDLKTLPLMVDFVIRFGFDLD